MAKDRRRTERLLHEMQDIARDGEREADHDEEWSAGNRRNLPGVQHEDVQNRRQQVVSARWSERFASTSLLSVSITRSASESDNCKPSAVSVRHTADGVQAHHERTPAYGLALERELYVVDVADERLTFLPRLRWRNFTGIDHAADDGLD